VENEKSKKKDLSKHQNFRYLIFGTIYLHQGFIEVFMYIFMALYLLSFGVSILIIGLTIAIGTSPWIIKIFYGIMTDRKASKKWGRRIPYMLVGSFFSAILFFLLIPLNPSTAWILFTLTIFVANFFNALCDTATDGLVVDTTTPEKRGTVQSVCWGSKLIGYIAASLLVGFLVEIFSWTIYFIFMGIFLLLPIPMLLMSKEPPYQISEKFPWKDLKDTFKMRMVWIVLSLFIVTSLATSIVFSMAPLFLSIELNLGLTEVGLVMAAGSLGFFIGTMISGPIFDKLSRKKGIIMALIFLMILFFMISLIQNLLMAFIFIILFGLAYGLNTIIKLIISMDICKKSISATMFSVYMSLYNLGNALGTIIGALLVEAYGFQFAFICGGLIMLSTLVLALFIRDTENLFADNNN